MKIFRRQTTSVTAQYRADCLAFGHGISHETHNIVFVFMMNAGDVTISGLEMTIEEAEKVHFTLWKSIEEAIRERKRMTN